MGEIHEWGSNSRATINDKGRADLYYLKYYLELRAGDDEGAVTDFWAEKVTSPEFVVAPDAHDSRTNSVTAANIRRILGDTQTIAVMVAGKVRRERLDMCEWLIENNYLPMFPRFMFSEANPAVPLTRHQLLHEMRPILDREPDWIFVLYGFQPQHEKVAYDYIASTQNTWEVLYA